MVSILPVFSVYMNCIGGTIPWVKAMDFHIKHVKQKTSFLSSSVHWKTSEILIQFKWKQRRKREEKEVKSSRVSKVSKYRKKMLSMNWRGFLFCAVITLFLKEQKPDEIRAASHQTKLLHTDLLNYIYLRNFLEKIVLFTLIDSYYWEVSLLLLA